MHPSAEGTVLAGARSGEWLSDVQLNRHTVRCVEQDLLQLAW
jgi:hypothetical protein